MTIYPEGAQAFLPPPVGTWRISFQEVFHNENDFWPLCDIQFDLRTSPADVDRKFNSCFHVHPTVYDVPKDEASLAFLESLNKTYPDDKNQDKYAGALARSILKGLLNVCTRSGLLRPHLDTPDFNSFVSAHGAVLIPDTNAIVNGAFHYVCRHYSASIGYVAITEEVENEIRNKLEEFKVTVDHLLAEKRRRAGETAEILPLLEKKTNPSGFKDMVNLRAWGISAMAGLRATGLPVEREIVPTLTSNLRAARGDEEIIRALAHFLKSRASTAVPFLLTYDYNMARFSEIRGTKVIFCRDPTFVEAFPAYSARLEQRAGHLVLVHHIDFIWALVAAFNAIRIEVDGDTNTYLIESYSRGVSYRSWCDGRLELTLQAQEFAPTTGAGDIDSGRQQVYEVGLSRFLIGALAVADGTIALNREDWERITGAKWDTVRDCFGLGAALGLWELDASNRPGALTGLQSFVSEWKRSGPGAVRDHFLAFYPALARFVGTLRKFGRVPLRDPKKLPEFGVSASGAKYLPKICEMFGLARVRDGSAVWTGEKVAQKQFDEFLLAYSASAQSDAYLRVADLVNEAYVKLHISHREFAARLEETIRSGRIELRVAGGVILKSDAQNAFDVLDWPDDDGFFQRVNLNDGFVIGDQSVKALSLRTAR